MSAKVWKKRIEAYNDGEPIKQSLITQIKSLFNRSFFTKSKEEVLLLEEVALYQYGRGPGWSITSLSVNDTVGLRISTGSTTMAVYNTNFQIWRLS